VITLGWQKTRRMISNLIKGIRYWKHTTDQSQKGKCNDTCYVCSTVQWSEADKGIALLDEADKVMFRYETKKIREEMPKEKTKHFVLMNDIFYNNSRLDPKNQFTTRDLDTEVFFDSYEFSGMCPIVRPTSEFFFAYVMYVHTKVRPHAGSEITLKEVNKKMYIPSNAKYFIDSIRNDCAKCKMLAKKTIRVGMAKHHESRTMITPIFYNLQMDVVYGFKAQPFKKSRTTVKVYALVMVCLLTSATSIMAMEGIQAQDVVSAIERHSARHGVPGQIFVDNGSQLKSLTDARFSIRSLDSYLHESLGMRVSVSSPKAHQQMGRVENKVKQIRLWLNRTNVNIDSPLSILQWETVFAKIANMVDDLPLSRGNSSNASDLGAEVITPNRLKLGRNNSRSLEGSMVLINRALPTEILERNRKITTAFYQIMIDRIHHLLARPPKWNHPTDLKLKPKDIVLFVFKDGNVNSEGKVWKLGKVVTAEETKATITYPMNSTGLTVPEWNTTERSKRDIVLVLSETDEYLNSTQYFQQICDKKFPCQE
jgi:hypothetical protein